MSELFWDTITERLVYFAGADNEADPALLTPVAWQAVKEYFIQQAKEIGQDWLQ